jgi:hypothetical protein
VVVVTLSVVVVVVDGFATPLVDDVDDDVGPTGGREVKIGAARGNGVGAKANGEGGRKTRGVGANINTKGVG